MRAVGGSTLLVGLSGALGSACGRVAFDRLGDLSDASSTVADTNMPDAETLTLLASDDFERTVGTSWGGMWFEYNVSGATTNVANGVAAVTLSASTQYADMRIDVTARDVRGSFVATIDAIPTAGVLAIGLPLRVSAPGVGYSLYAELMADATIYGTLRAGPSVFLTASTPMVTGLIPGEPLAFELQVLGVGPATLCGRIWRAGMPRPADCMLRVDDSSPSLEAPGLPYVTAGTYSATPLPVTCSFDTFRYYEVSP